MRHLATLLGRDMRYGSDVSRDEVYDALASAALTSNFSFAFAASILARLEFHSLLDLGCGTGAFLNYLAGRDFQAQLSGLDHSETAIEYGKLQCANYSQIQIPATTSRWVINNYHPTSREELLQHGVVGSFAGTIAICGLLSEPSE